MLPYDESPLPARPWQVVAKEMAKETNAERILELARELDRALDKQDGPLATQDSDGRAQSSS